MTSKENSSDPAPLFGLVLAGGRSKRMGKDKGAMHWHGKEQRYYMADMLVGVCSDVFISCREDQVWEIDVKYKALKDSYTGIGPYGAILSAFKFKPDSAWLVIACDLPLMDAATLSYLVQERDDNYIATTFKSPFDGLPEPLITIWEPASEEVLLAYLSEGYSCPRKTLIKSGERVKILMPPNEDALLNANTPEDAAKVKEILNLA